MTTEKKIKEACAAWQIKNYCALEDHDTHMEGFRAGYLALLNSLEKCGTINSTGHPKHISHIYGTYELQVYGNPAPVFRLPEGVTKP